MGRKKWLQNESNLCFGVKDASHLFTDQYMAQSKGNFINSFLNHLKFDLSSLELVFCGKIKTYVKEAISVCWPLSKEAPGAGAEMQVPGWICAQGKAPVAAQGKSGPWPLEAL